MARTVRQKNEYRDNGNGTTNVIIDYLHGQVCAVVDSEDVPLLKQWHWGWSTGNKIQGYKCGDSSRHTKTLKGIVLGFTERMPRITHRNDDGLDCRKANLHIVDKHHRESVAATAPLQVQPEHIHGDAMKEGYWHPQIQTCPAAEIINCLRINGKLYELKEVA